MAASVKLTFYQGYSDISTWTTNITKLTPNTEVRYLGAIIGNNVRPENIWNNYIQKLNTHSLLALQLNLNLDTRVKAAETYLTSTIRYNLSILPLKKAEEKTMTKIIQTFALGKDRSFLTRKTLELNYKHGGIKLPNIQKIREIGRAHV